MTNIFKKISIDLSTYILILLALLAGYIKNIFIILLIVIVHELGHVFFFLLFHIEIEKIVIYPYGGMTTVNKRLHERIYKDILISLGGILFQFILWGIFFFLYQNGWIVTRTWEIFYLYNKSIILFNLIPIVPLDGSKLFFSLCSKFFSYRKSYALMVFMGGISLIFFVFYNFLYRLNDIVLYVFLIYQLIIIISEFKYVMNKFYLERILYDNYYNRIIHDVDDIGKIRIDKYYYFRDGKRYVNEKEYLKRVKY